MRDVIKLFTDLQYLHPITWIYFGIAVAMTPVNWYLVWRAARWIVKPHPRIRAAWHWTLNTLAQAEEEERTKHGK